MAIIDALTAEYQHEAGVTRRVLDRVASDKFSWTPHDKSMTAGRLASHIVEMQGWVPGVLTQDEFKVDNYQPFAAKSTEDLVGTFDKLVAESTKAMKGGVSDQTLMTKWKMTRGGETVFEMPKVQVLRMFVLSHVIHHRGQLSVYLRLLGVPVPSIYGPSADEKM